MKRPFHEVICDGHALGRDNVTIQSHPDTAKISCTTFAARQFQRVQRVVGLERTSMEISSEGRAALTLPAAETSSCTRIHLLRLIERLCGDLRTHASEVVPEAHHS